MSTNTNPYISGRLQMSTIINQKARAEGLKIVRIILKSNPNGFTTSQLFQVAVQQPPPPYFLAYQPWPPSHPEHPIRSIKCITFSPSCSMSFDQFAWLGS